MGAVDSITVLWGLPGSGKTHFIKDEVSKHRGYNTVPVVFALDYTLNTSYGEFSLVEHGILQNSEMSVRERERRLQNSIEYFEKVVKEGRKTYIEYSDIPCCTYKEFSAIIEKLFLHIKEAKLVKVVYWEPDREACLYNDDGRREHSSRLSILNMPFEVPAEDRIRDIIKDELGYDKKVKVIRKTVVRKPEWKHVFNDVVTAHREPLLFTGKVTSRGYCLGGEARDICGRTSYTIDAEPMGRFVELDEILERICPSLTFIQYREMFDSLVKIEQRQDRDYYADVSEAYYEIDLESLYSWLMDNDVKLAIDEDD